MDTCEHGPIVVVEHRDGPFLLDGSRRRLITDSWSSGDADHFVASLAPATTARSRSSTR